MLQMAISGVHTAYQFHDFSFIQILCEINFGDFRGAKSVVILNYDFLRFLKAEIDT